MASKEGISGTAVALATAGAFLMYVGIQGVSIRDGLRALVGGQLPKGTRRPTGALDSAEGSLRTGTPGAASSTSGGGTAAPASGAGAKLVAEAMKWKGVKYVLGGEDRNGVDCSSLVMIAFRDGLGVTSPRTTYTQVKWNQLTKIPREKAGPGDLAFWPAGGSPGHVAIVIDDGRTVIHAPRPGKSVEVVPIGQAFTGGLKPDVYRYTGKKS